MSEEILKFKIGDKVRKVSSGVMGKVVNTIGSPWGKQWPYQVSFPSCTGWFMESELMAVEPKEG